MFSIIIFKKVCFVGSGLLNSSYLPPSNRWIKLEWGFLSVFPLLSSLQPPTLPFIVGGGVTSQQESTPKPNPLNPGGVLVPGPGFELGKARLVLESGTSYPATSTLRSGALPGGVWGSLEVDAGQT